ncbi:MAG: 3'-5' exonuclease [Pontiellaceae bacterium]|nr:3'-5' exonuclease [Pontiellaceae bacterium]
MPWSRQKHPAFVEHYLERTHPGIARKKPLDQLRVVALDTEASGFEIGKDRLLSVAVIDIDWTHIRLDHRIEWLVYQPNMVANKATEIHGILPSDILQGMPEKQMLTELLPIISESIVVGHQTWFDALMLDEALRRNFGIPFRNPIIDVAALAMTELQRFRKSGYANQKPPSLEDLCATFGLPLHDRHTAEGDAFIAAELFLLMCGHIRQRKGGITRRDLPIKKV